ncbi:SOS response-associated peptidase [soil metagenome]
MCGRFAMSGDLDFYAQYYGVTDDDIEPIEHNWNVAPTDESYVVSERDETRHLSRMRWGVIPHWTRDSKTIHINARAESVATKPAFRKAFSIHRCLIPADGFYEWEPKERGRAPHWVFRADGHPMSFAGIWAAWRPTETDGWERRFAIITTEAAGPIATIHDRMPVILAAEVWEPWLDRSLTDPEEALALLRPLDSDLIMEHAVSSEVNSVRNNHPGLRDPHSDTLF